jgi:hypothetical protein
MRGEQKIAVQAGTNSLSEGGVPRRSDSNSASSSGRRGAPPSENSSFRHTGFHLFTGDFAHFLIPPGQFDGR